MKTKLFITGFLVIMNSNYANSQSGIYMNLSDFKNNKLTYENNPKAIRIHDFFWHMPGISVVTDGKKVRLKKHDIYGYRNGNEVYRFYNNTEYRIAEEGGINVYAQEKNIAQSKGFKVVNEYYFSTTSDGAILPLSVANLKAAYHGNSRYLAIIDAYLSDENIAEYDKEHNTFKVNYILLKTN